MKMKFIALSSLLAITLMTGCQVVEDQKSTIVEEQAKNTAYREITVNPVASMSFQGEPSDSEIRASIKQRAEYNPAWGTPGPGEKMVTIITKTGPGEWNGTDSPVKLKVGYDALSVMYVINNPDLDDRQVGSTDIFVFHVKTGEPWDELRYAELSIEGTDGWLCEYLSIREDGMHHYKGNTVESGRVNTRFENFEFNATLDEDQTQTPVIRRNSTNQSVRLDLK